MKSQAGSAAGKSAQRERAKGRLGAKGRGRQIVDEALCLRVWGVRCVEERVEKGEGKMWSLRRFLELRLSFGENPRGASCN